MSDRFSVIFCRIEMTEESFEDDFFSEFADWILVSREASVLYGAMDGGDEHSSRIIGGEWWTDNCVSPRLSFMLLVMVSITRIKIFSTIFVL